MDGDATNKVLCVRNWATIFESYESKKVVGARWFKFENDQCDPWFVALMQLADGPALFGVWCALLMMASRCHVRGTFADKYEQPYSLATIASVCRVNLDLLTKAVDVMSLQIPWLEMKPVNSKDSAVNPAGDAVEPVRHAAAKVEDAVASAFHAAKPGLQDRTGDYRTRQDSSSRTAEPAAAAAEISADEWEEAWNIANTILHTGWPNMSLAAMSNYLRMWIVKVAVLTVRFGDDWLQPALDATQRTKAEKPDRFMGKILKEQCERRGTTLDGEFGKIKIPSNLLQRRNVGVLQPTAATPSLASNGQV